MKKQRKFQFSHRSLFLGAILGAALSLFQISNTKFGDEKEKVTSFERYGLPASHPIIRKDEYALAYDGKTRSALWVYEHLTQETLQNNHPRKTTQFKEESSLDPCFRSSLRDYKGSGYDIGHLCPSADHRSSLESLEQTFTLANAAPQIPWFNRGYWYKLEKEIRIWAHAHENTYVVTGGLFLPIETEDLNYVQYPVIGKSNVAVPTHFYKVILFQNGDNISLKSYLLPHEIIPIETPLEEFEIDVRSLESLSGIIFFPKLDSEGSQKYKKKLH